MTEHPILFSGAMVAALLAGTKTQTRRVVKGVQPWGIRDGKPEWAIVGTKPRCPYGQPGDRLWVRESWMPDPPNDGTWAYTAWAGERTGQIAGVPERFRQSKFCNYAADWPYGPVLWTPSIHMPRWASRITLEVTEVRVERLQDISEADARAEGIADGGCTECGNSEPCGCDSPSPDARDSFARLWMDINGDESWLANPWVWAVSFKAVKGGAL